MKAVEMTCPMVLFVFSSNVFFKVFIRLVFWVKGVITA